MTGWASSKESILPNRPMQHCVTGTFSFSTRRRKFSGTVWWACDLSKLMVQRVRLKHPPSVSLTTYECGSGQTDAIVPGHHFFPTLVYSSWPTSWFQLIQNYDFKSIYFIQNQNQLLLFIFWFFIWNPSHFQYWFEINLWPFTGNDTELPLKYSNIKSPLLKCWYFSKWKKVFAWRRVCIWRRSDK